MYHITNYRLLVKAFPKTGYLHTLAHIWILVSHKCSFSHCLTWDFQVICLISHYFILNLLEFDWGLYSVRFGLHWPMRSEVLACKCTFSLWLCLSHTHAHTKKQVKKNVYPRNKLNNRSDSQIHSKLLKFFIWQIHQAYVFI